MAVALDPNAVAAGFGLSLTYEDRRGTASLFLPQQVAVIGQGNSAVTYTTDPWRVTTLRECGSRYGIGSPVYLAVKMLMPPNGDGVGTIPVTVYPLQDHASGSPSAGTITIAGTATAATSIRFRIGGVLTQAFTVPVGAVNATTVHAAAKAAIEATLDVPTIMTGTTSLTATSRWEGVSANGIKIEAIAESLNGVTVTIVQPTGGTNNPDVTVALNQIVTRWETMIVNCLNHDDTVALGAIFTWGEGRWVPQIMKPAIAFVGCNVASSTTAIAVSDARKTDYVNSQINDPGSPDLPLLIAARAVARIAYVANSNPPTGYTGQKLTQTTPGAESSQWDFTMRNAVKLGGGSTVDLVDGVVQLSDVVTMYHPTGENPPAYAEVVTIVKLQNAIYNYRLPFMAQEWAAAPLIPDGQVTRNPNARTPSAAKGEADAVTERLALDAILSDPKTIKKGTTARIAGPNRVDVVVPLYVSGNTFQKAIELSFAFYFGS
jgi:phage tail sheath gpL-like